MVRVLHPDLQLPVTESETVLKPKTGILYTLIEKCVRATGYIYNILYGDNVTLFKFRQLKAGSEGLPDPEPDPVVGGTRIRIRKNLDSFCFATSLFLFIFEKWYK